MPRVPTPTTKVDLTAAPNRQYDASQVSPGPDAFGAPQGRALEGLGQTVANAGVQAEHALLAERDRQAKAAKDRADQLATLKAGNDLSEWTTKALYDPTDGALNVKGKDAAGLPDVVGKAFNEQADQIAQGLTTPEQRDRFMAIRLQHGNALNQRLMEHVSSEITAYDKQETARGIENAVNDARLSAEDPRQVNTALQKGAAITLDHAKANGLGPEATTAALSGFVTATHTAVIDELLARGKDQSAQAYFDATKDQISGESLTKIERALQEGNLRGAGQRASDQILATTTSESAALDAAKQIDDPKLRDEVQSRVEHEWAIRSEAQRGADRQTMVTLGNLIDANPSKGVRAIPPDQWSALTVDQKENFERYAKRNLKPAGEGQSNDVLFYNLLKQASTDPDGFAKLVLSDPKYRANLSKGDWHHVIEVQASILKGDKPKADQLLDGFRTNEQIVNDTLDQSGIAHSGDKANPTEVATFRRLVDQQVETLQRNTGKKATNDDVQRISDDLVQRAVVTPNSWYWRLLGSPVTAKRLIDVTIDDVPTATRRQIEQALQRGHVPVTDQNILQTYVNSQLKTGAK